MTQKQRQIFTYIALAFCIALFFIPVRYDIVTAAFVEDASGNIVTKPDSKIFTSTIVHFQGHPAGRISLGLFALMPFWFMLQSTLLLRPLHIWSHLFLRLQGLLMILGGPYLVYVLTFEYVGFEHVQHHNELAIGGYYIVGQTVLMGIFIFYLIASPKSKLTEIIFPLRGAKAGEEIQQKKREGW